MKFWCCHHTINAPLSLSFLCFRTQLSESPTLASNSCKLYSLNPKQPSLQQTIDLLKQVTLSRHSLSISLLCRNTPTMSNRLPFNLPPGGIHMTTVSVIGGQTVRYEMEIDPSGRFSDSHQADSTEVFNAFRRFQEGFYAPATAPLASTLDAAVQLPSISAPRSNANPRPEAPAASRNPRAVVVDIERAQVVTASRERRTYTFGPPPSPPSTSPPPLLRSVVSQPSESNTITSGETLSISHGSRPTNSRSAINAATIPSTVPAPPGSRAYARLMGILNTAKAAQRSADALQGSTIEQFKDILMKLYTHMTRERKLQARELFDQQMANNAEQLRNLRENHGQVRDMEYGSAWELDGIQPLETRVSTPVHVLDIFPSCELQG